MLRLTSLTAVAVFSLSSLALPTAAVASDINAATVSNRIDVAGRQRMLTQRMAKLFCFAQSGAAVETNLAKLQDARDLFRKSHLGMAQGDEAMGLFPEGKPEVLSAWSEVDQQWQNLDAAYAKLTTGETVTRQQFDAVLRLTAAQMAKSQALVTIQRDTYAEYLGAGLGDAVMLDFYGRQRALSQKMAKDVCLAARGDRGDGLLVELTDTIGIFDNSLTAFIDGMPMAGIAPPPTDAIAAQLNVAKDIWTPIRPTALAIAAGKSVDAAAFETFSLEIDRFLIEMNKAVGMLADYEANKSG